MIAILDRAMIERFIEDDTNGKESKDAYLMTGT